MVASYTALIDFKSHDTSHRIYFGDLFGSDDRDVSPNNMNRLIVVMEIRRVVRDIGIYL
jgi:hypothetical protein